MGGRVNSRKRRDELNARWLTRDKIVAGLARLARTNGRATGHNHLNVRGWINCCISHGKFILIRYGRFYADAKFAPPSSHEPAQPSSSIIIRVQRTGYIPKFPPARGI